MVDFYVVSGDPATRSSLASSPIRAELTEIQTQMAKLADYTGNANKLVVINSGGTGYTTLDAVSVVTGGTGLSTITDGGVLLGSGTGAITAMAVLADSEMIVGDGTTDPVAESGATLRTSIGVGTGDSPTFTGLTVTSKLRSSDETATDQNSGSEVVDGAGTFRNVGFNVMPITGISGNTDLRQANAGHQLRCTASLTVDMDTTTDSAPDGSVWIIVNESGGDITISDTGVTMTWLDANGGTTGDRTLADGSFSQVIKRADGQYQLTGNGIS